MSRNYTVDCAEHGQMARDQPRFGWECPVPGCQARLPDEEVYRLVKLAPDHSLDPLPIVVT